LDQHEILNLCSRNLLGRVIGHVNAWMLDYYLSKAVLFGAVAQHFTIVAQKPPAQNSRSALPARDTATMHVEGGG
jgi:hypothetical protein